MPGARIYVLGKDAGGYLFDWREQPNPAADHDPRDRAACQHRNTYLDADDDANAEQSDGYVGA